MLEPNAPRLVLVTGLSGAGKSQALRILEDIGYYCVDNLPAQFIRHFCELFMGGQGAYRRVAICVDARSGEALANLPAFLDEVAELGARPDALFLDCSDKVLVQRYSETRRRHPLAPDSSVGEGIRRERALLEPMRERADLVLDTSTLSIIDLRESIAGMFAPDKKSREIIITVMSFGFKFGLPQEANIVLDVRFLPNPYYDPDMRERTGNEPDVEKFVMENPVAEEFMKHGKAMLKFLLPQYEAEPKSYLVIAVGCTGGRHRSVAVANELALYLRARNYNVRVKHRDIAPRS